MSYREFLDTAFTFIHIQTDWLIISVTHYTYPHHGRKKLPSTIRINNKCIKVIRHSNITVRKLYGVTRNIRC